MSVTISEILRGVEVGRMQAVGNMQIIPLLSDMVHEGFSTPDELEVGTSNYGTIEFNNRSDKEVIIPCHAGYIVKQAAQDHAMTHAGFVSKKQRKSYSTAACIQETQGGTISRGQHEMLILPYSLREVALKSRSGNSYSKLWDSIRSFNKQYQISGNAHLSYFFNEFEKELDSFVAQFEIVPRQVGAIVLINGEVVGIERVPSYEFWKSVWKPLIRECYGSLSIYEAKNSTFDPSEIKTPLKNRHRSLEALAADVEMTQVKDEAKAKSIVRKFLQDPFTETVEENTNDCSIVTLEHEQFVGQCVKRGMEVVYSSLISTSTYKENKNWLEAEPFTI